MATDQWLNNSDILRFDKKLHVSSSLKNVTVHTFIFPLCCFNAQDHGGTGAHPTCPRVKGGFTLWTYDPFVIRRTA